MYKKLYILIALIIAGTTAVYAAPYYTFTRTIIPEADNAFDLGTSTARYRNLFISGTCTGCPTASPGGSDTQVQFNDSSTFGGDSGLTYNKTLDKLTTVYASSTAQTIADGNASLFISNMATTTAYTKLGGTGNRKPFITVTTSITGLNGTPDYLVNGNTADNFFYWGGQTAAGKYLRFDFGAVYRPIIQEATWYQDVGTSQGTWQWQGSNDASTWTNIGGNFTLGGATTQTQTELSGNTTPYRYYQLLGISGSLSGAPYDQEIEFKIAQGLAASILNSSNNNPFLLLQGDGGLTKVGGNLHVNGNIFMGTNTPVVSSQWVNSGADVYFTGNDGVTGYVGVGRSPTSGYFLDVNRYIRVIGGGGNQEGAIYFQNSTGAGSMRILTDAVSSPIFGIANGAVIGLDGDASGLRIYDGSTVERVRFQRNGVSGFGSSTPFATLAVNPTAGVASNQFVVGSSTATAFVIGNDRRAAFGTASTSHAGVTINLGGDITYAVPLPETATQDLGLLISKTDGGNSRTGIAIIGRTVGGGVGKSEIYLGHSGDPDDGLLSYDYDTDKLEMYLGSASSPNYVFDTTNKFGYGLSGAVKYSLHLGSPSNGIFDQLAMQSQAFGVWDQFLEWSVSSGGSDALGTLRFQNVESNATSTPPITMVGSRVGISSTTPWGRLAVANFANSTYMTNQFIVASSTASATTTHFVVNANGRVGIGTSTPATTLQLTAGLATTTMTVGELGGAGCVNMVKPDGTMASYFINNANVLTVEGSACK